MSGAILTALPGINQLENDQSARQSFPISVREPEGGPAHFQVSDKASVAYKSSLDNIVALVRDVRPQPVSADEYKVTMTLARPFKRGGLLVLLQEPLWNHPWAEGVDAVISRCATLTMLREGIWVASSGKLSLIDHVSVIDRWPLLPRARHTELERTKPEKMRRLDRLVLQAIRTKKPDTILCMGKAAKQFLEPYLTQLLSTAPNGPEVIYSIHPSHSANYKTGDCLKLRDDVLSAIRQACQFPESKEVAPQQKLSLPKLISHALPSLTPTDRTPAKARDIEIIHEFLDVVVRMCFPDGNTFPVHSIRADQNAPKSYFAFTGPQIYYLRHSLICEDTTPTDKSSARKVLIPIFLRLNATLRRVSYFLPVYEDDWDRISMVLSNVPEDLENLCMEAGQFRESLDYDVFSVTELFDQLPFPGFEDECARSIARLERITWRLQNERTAVKSTHTRLTTCRLERCRCTTRVRFPDIELTRAFDAAYVAEHDCNDCNRTRRG